jgi:RNA polymerase sigma-70 factor, ECF subfamily
MNGQVIAMTAAVDDARSPDDPGSRLGALFDAHHQRVHTMARRLTRSADDARDVVQETFLRAARSPQSIPHGASNEEAWLVRVLINICRDRWRHAAVRTRAMAEGHLQPGRGSHPEAALLARRLVWQALDALPPRRRAILVLYELEGATIPAISRLLGVRPVTVRWHLSIGRREMAQALASRPEASGRVEGGQS